MARILTKSAKVHGRRRKRQLQNLVATSLTCKNTEGNLPEVLQVDAEYFGRKSDLLYIIYRKCAVVSQFGDPLN